mgnify:CR=1 FL=1
MITGFEITDRGLDHLHILQLELRRDTKTNAPRTAKWQEVRLLLRLQSAENYDLVDTSPSWVLLTLDRLVSMGYVDRTDKGRGGWSPSDEYEDWVRKTQLEDL